MAHSRRKVKLVTLFQCGLRGRSTVRLSRDARGLWLIWQDPNTRQRRQRKLPHRDVEKGREEALDQEGQLRQATGTLLGPATLHRLFDIYERQAMGSYGVRTRQHYQAVFRMMRQLWGPEVLAGTLGREHVRQYEAYRHQLGDQRAGKQGQPISSTMVRKDLVKLLAVLNWAEEQKHLPAHHLSLKMLPPKDQEHRPLITNAEVADLLTAHEAGCAHEQAPPAIRRVFLEAVHELGQRRKQMTKLQWADIDFANRRVQFRRTHSKNRREYWVPMSEQAAHLFTRWRTEQAQLVGSTPWVFHAPRAPQESLSVYTVGQWFKRLQRRAKLPPLKGRGWHSFRRKLVTDVKGDLEPVDIRGLGGWASTAMVEVYMQEEEHKQRAALNKRSRRLPRSG